MVAGTLVLAASRYWLSLAGVVQEEMSRWNEHARGIADPQLRTLALSKLEAEGFNARAAGMLATFAPRGRRRGIVRTIVALEVLFDYLDGRTEPAGEGDPLAWRMGLFAVFNWAISEPGAEHEQPVVPDVADGAYLAALAQAVSDGLRELPSYESLRAAMSPAAARATQAQVRKHAIGELGEGQLRAWAEEAAVGSGFEWREYLAGACASVLAIHALIVAGAAPSSRAGAGENIDRLYLAIGAIAALLDELVDHDIEDDGDFGPRRNAAELEHSLARLTEATAVQARHSQHPRRDLAILAGVLGYYATAPGARTAFAAPIAAQLRDQHVWIGPACALMGAWRALESRGRRGTRRRALPRAEPDLGHR
jgi:tetraprenyl-beta-curcumene synthase